MKNRDVVLSINDLHIPFHDEDAIKVAFKFAKYIDPKIIVLHEWLDWYPISRFDKDPGRIDDLQKDLKIMHKYLNDLRKLLPETRMVMVKSNHDARLEKYKRTHAIPFHCLEALEIEGLFKLAEYNIQYRNDFTFQGVLCKHGNIVRKYSAYTAKAELVDEGVSGMSGHTHRLGMHFETNRGGKYVWMECGCLCDPAPEYIIGVANWQTGLGMLAFKPNSKHFYPCLIPIIDHEIIWGSETFKV